MKNLLDHVIWAMEQVEQGISRLGERDHTVEGMSGRRGRSLLNWLCSGRTIRYLEVGLWKGTTFFSALEGNAIEAFGVDNWSQFGGPQAYFFDRLERYRGDNRVTIIEQDAFSLDLSQICNGINVYFYDGSHDHQSHERALTYFAPILADPFVLIVDDYNWPQVVAGTNDAMEKLGFTCLLRRHLGQGGYEDKDGWWNGMLLAVVKK